GRGRGAVRASPAPAGGRAGRSSARAGGCARCGSDRVAAGTGVPSTRLGGAVATDGRAGAPGRADGRRGSLSSRVPARIRGRNALRRVVVSGGPYFGL